MKRKNYMSNPEIVQKNSKILGGQPVIRGTRIPVARVLALIAMGYTLKDIKKELPDLSLLTKKHIADIFSYHKNRLAL